MPSDDLEPRVDALETQVHKLGERVRANEQDIAAARILAGAADRETDEFTSSFNALREDLMDLRGYVDEQFDLVNGGFIEMRGRFDATAAGQQRIVTLLEGLIAGQG